MLFGSGLGLTVPIDTLPRRTVGGGFAVGPEKTLCQCAQSKTRR